jgi:hypothetical protein
MRRGMLPIKDAMQIAGVKEIGLLLGVTAEAHI